MLNPSFIHAEHSGFTISPLERKDEGAWDAFVSQTERGSFFHQAGWRTIYEDIFRFRTHYLAAWREGLIAAVLPLVEQKSILFGHGLISAPFCVEGGPIGDEEACLELDRTAMGLMKQRAVSFLEYRSRKARRADWHTKADLNATFSRPLAADEETYLQAIPRMQRAVVRKTLQSGLTVRRDYGPADFYPVYSRSVHNLGTPVFPKKYFERLCEVFPDQSDFVIVSDDAGPVSAVMNFYFRETVLPYYGGGLAAARKSGANDRLSRVGMRRASLRGFRRFDFGRSMAGTGAFAFKKYWGRDPDWLEYQY